MGMTNVYLALSQISIWDYARYSWIASDAGNWSVCFYTTAPDGHCNTFDLAENKFVCLFTNVWHCIYGCVGAQHPTSEQIHCAVYIILFINTTNSGCCFSARHVQT